MRRKLRKRKPQPSVRRTKYDKAILTRIGLKLCDEAKANGTARDLNKTGSAIWNAYWNSLNL